MTKKSKKNNEPLFKLIDLVKQSEGIRYSLIMMRLSSVGLYDQFQEELSEPHKATPSITKTRFNEIIGGN